jgi:hypothetical protein
MQCYILLKKSQAVWDERDGPRTLTLAQAAKNGPWTLSPRVHAEVVQQETRGLAVIGKTQQHITRNLDEAWAILGGIQW